MNTAVATKTSGGSEIMESVLIKGDLSKLTPQERGTYYMRVCESVGLNPLTKPFEYIILNGKLTLYALRAATDQLRTIHNVSVEELNETERDGVFVVTAKVRNGEGRTDMAKGAVPIANLKGDALANALMKAETKAKRRATLSLCGLGLLDETEIENIPGAVKAPPKAAPVAIAKPQEQASQHDMETGEVIEAVEPFEFDPPGPTEWPAFGQAIIDQVRRDPSRGTDWLMANEKQISIMNKNARKLYDRMMAVVNKIMDEASGGEAA